MSWAFGLLKNTNNTKPNIQVSDEDFNSFDGRTSKQDAVADAGCGSCCKLCKNNLPFRGIEVMLRGCFLGQLPQFVYFLFQARGSISASARGLKLRRSQRLSQHAQREPGVGPSCRQDSRRTDRFDYSWLQSLRRTAGVHVCICGRVCVAAVQRHSNL